MKIHGSEVATPWTCCSHHRTAGYGHNDPHDLERKMVGREDDQILSKMKGDKLKIVNCFVYFSRRYRYMNFFFLQNARIKCYMKKGTSSVSNSALVYLCY